MGDRNFDYHVTMMSSMGSAGGPLLRRETPGVLAPDSVTWSGPQSDLSPQ